jgi:Histidinol-phosphate/aromatic aminotransferase and cobyric acid decarboxylase
MSDRPPGLDAAGIVAAVVRPEICALSAYTTASAGDMIKLDAMENPFPLPDAVRRRLGTALAHVAVNRYPDITADRVKEALAGAFGISDTLGLLLGNGSDELIQLITVALARPGAAMLAPEPSFVMYRLNASMPACALSACRWRATSASTAMRCWPQSSASAPR